MEINHVPTFGIATSVRRTLLKLATLIVLGASWLAFFLWALLLTEEGVRYWRIQAEQEPVGQWFSLFLAFIGTPIGSYAPATALLLISLTLYFYRAPRVRGALKLPLEFATSIVLFLGLHLLLFCVLSVPTELRWITSFTNGGSASEPSLVLTLPGLLLTGLLLELLYWCQGSGRLRTYWRTLRRALHGVLLHFPRL